MRVCLLGIVLLIALRAAPATVNVPLPPESRATGNRLVLHFENLKLPPDSSGIVHVFADLPGADARTSTDDEHFLGYFTLVPKNSTEAARGIERASATLDLTTKKQRLAGKREVTLTIVRWDARLCSRRSRQARRQLNQLLVASTSRKNSRREAWLTTARAAAVGFTAATQYCARPAFVRSPGRSSQSLPPRRTARALRGCAR